MKAKCRKCTWWDVLSLDEMKDLHLNAYSIEKGAGHCRLEPKSEVTLSNDRCRHFQVASKPADTNWVAKEISSLWEALGRLTDCVNR